MTIKRRHFLTTGLAAIASQVPLSTLQAKTAPQAIIKPPRLRIGDTVGLINPASPIDREDVLKSQQVLSGLGLKVKLGAHILDQYGYLAGKDADRAADVNAMFADGTVKAIIAMRGGWGCNRILPLLNYNLIRSRPKIVLGYSDITSLLLAIYTRTRLVGFHGAVATSTWNDFTVNYAQRILFHGEAVTMGNTPETQVRKLTITPGKARGRLLGGNLSVLSAMVGSSYLPVWKDSILFVEEIGEDIYRVDRMLTQLKLAGILNQISGFVFGECTNCKLGDTPSLTLIQVLQAHIRPLGIPAWYGSMIGHIKDKFTVPLGVEVEVDVVAGTIKMLEKAVI